MAEDKTDGFVRAVCTYLRDSLADADRNSPDVRSLRESAQPSYHAIKSGSLPADVVQWIFGKVEAGLKKGEEKPQAVAVLVCPWRAALAYRHSKQQTGGYPTELKPLWIPAILNRTGMLSPSADKNPWISREVLEPQVSNTVTIGHIDSVDAFMSEHSCETREWSERWEYSQDMFKAVSGMAMENYLIEGYEMQETGYVVLDQELRGIPASIMKLYDEMLDKDRVSEIPTLVKRAVLGSEETLTMDPMSLARNMGERHMGQMGNKYALAQSQRKALHALLSLQEGEALAINGPPGTGKTTFIQSVVASLWTMAAFHEGDPPIIMAVSSNNQAVTNIIDSFGVAGSEENGDGFFERWIPGVRSFGLYLPSSASTNHGKYQTMQPNGVGFFTKMEQRAFLEDAEKTFIEKCSGFFGYANSLSLTEAKSQLHGILASDAKTLGDGLHAIEKRRRVGAEIAALGGMSSVRGMFDELEKKKAHTNDRLTTLHAELMAFRHQIAQRPLRMAIFSSLPPVKRQMANFNLSSFERCFRSLSIETDWADDKKIIEVVESHVAHIRHELDRCESEQHHLRDLISDWETINNEIRFIEKTIPGIGDEHIDGIDEVLDKGIRYKMFWTAAHYWEARWLLESKKSLREKPDQDRKGFYRKWKRYAMLTPVFVSTFHMLPKNFCIYGKGEEFSPPWHMYDYIDLLIVDEAGQVTPEISVASLALAKKMLAVGDTFQLEPVHKISKAIDFGNLASHGLSNHEGRLETGGLKCSSGSFMVIAQQATHIVESDVYRGLMFVEHRRCVPEIISYCNDLAYNHMLQPKRESISKEQRILPAMGYAHIHGEMRVGTRENPVEAAAIADWVDHQRGKMEKHYNMDLSDIVAIITPFRDQKELLRKEFAGRGLPVLDKQGIIIGTVHALQGAERPVVIFSPVYGRNHEGTVWFDSANNFLNVAVSRAKDSFLVFGNTQIFARYGDCTPSGLLGRLLFSDPENEIVNIEPSTTRRFSCERIADLEGHLRILDYVLEQACKSILIVSPQISTGALLWEDRIVPRLRSAVNRGVDVRVLTDRSLDSVNGVLRKSAEQGRSILLDTGVDLIVADGIHNKTLCKDRDLVVEGSFNWLSAVREKGHPWQRDEVSLCYSGSRVDRFIDSMWVRALELQSQNRGVC